MSHYRVDPAALLYCVLNQLRYDQAVARIFAWGSDLSLPSLPLLSPISSFLFPSLPFLLLKSSQGFWRSAVSSPSRIQGGARPQTHFDAFTCSFQNACHANIPPNISGVGVSTP